MRIGAAMYLSLFLSDSIEEGSHMEEVKYAAIYTRVSTEEQRNEGCSLEAQQEELISYAQRKGYTIYDVYSDGGYSGKDYNRPEIQRLFRDMTANKFEAIIVWRLDRLSRSNKDILTLIDDELTPRGIKLLVSTCDIDSSTIEGKMFISLQGTFAEYERNVIINRVKAGMKKKASNGEFNGGIMLGYDVVDKKLVPNEAEAKIVREIFELRAEGHGYKTITNIMNSSGHKTKKGNNFSTIAIKTILNNKEYAGLNTWGKKEDWNIKRRKGKVDVMPERKGSHQPIISMELWEKVQAVNKANAEVFTPIKSYSGNFFLSGVLKCPVCGAGMVMSKNKKRGNKGFYRYYMCQAYHQKGKVACSSNLVVADWIEQEVLNVLKELIADMDLVEDILDKIDEGYKRDKTPLEANLNELNLRKAEHEKKINSLDEKYLAGELEVANFNRLSSKLQSEIDEMTEMIEEVERELTKLQSRVDINANLVVEILANFNKLFDLADEQEKKELIRSIIKEIHVSKDRKELKQISLWIGEDICLPAKKERGTVP